MNSIGKNCEDIVNEYKSDLEELDKDRLRVQCLFAISACEYQKISITHDSNQTEGTYIEYYDKAYFKIEDKQKKIEAILLKHSTSS